MCMYCDSTLRKVLDSVPPQCVMSSTKYFSVLKNMFFLSSEEFFLITCIILKLQLI